MNLIEFGWVNRHVLKDEEIETIITKHLNLTEENEINGTLIFSKKFLEKCSAVFKEKIIEFIYHTPQKLMENNENVKKTTKKGKKKGKF